MKKTKLILLLGFFFTQTTYAQCDKSSRDKIIFASLNYFQDSINKPKTNILLVDTTQYSEYPNYSFEPDLLKVLPDTSILADLLSGFRRTFKLKLSQTSLNSCPKIALTSLKIISQTLHDSAGWRHFYKINPNTSGLIVTGKQIGRAHV